MRVVLDTNVLISAFVNRGLCSEVYEHCLKSRSLVLSDYILREVEKNLHQKVGQSVSDAAEAVWVLGQEAILVVPLPLGESVCADPADDPILGTALAGEVSILVTGDRDLLTLKRYRSIRIVSPREFWREAMQGRDRDA